MTETDNRATSNSIFTGGVEVHEIKADTRVAEIQCPGEFNTHSAQALKDAEILTHVMKQTVSHRATEWEHSWLPCLWRGIPAPARLRRDARQCQLH